MHDQMKMMSFDIQDLVLTQDGQQTVLERQTDEGDILEGKSAQCLFRGRHGEEVGKGDENLKEAALLQHK
jgi:hypothetical protein